jgi:hypothetical protein
MNTINGLTKENQDSFNEALALLVKVGGREKAKALRDQLEGRSRLVVKETVRDWMCIDAPSQVNEADKAPFTLEADLYSQQPSIAFYSNGQLAGELRVEISKGTPCVHINTAEDSSLAHIHFAQGGIVITTDNPALTPEAAERDRHAYHQDSILIRHQRNDALLEETADAAFADHDFGFEVLESSAWRKEEALHWVLTVSGEDEQGNAKRSTFHVRFDERYEEVIAKAYALDLATGSDS